MYSFDKIKMYKKRVTQNHNFEKIDFFRAPPQNLLDFIKKLKYQ